MLGHGLPDGIDCVGNDVLKAAFCCGCCGSDDYVPVVLPIHLCTCTRWNSGTRGTKPIGDPIFDSRKICDKITWRRSERIGANYFVERGFYE